jgi:gluconate kinase
MESKTQNTQAAELKKQVQLLQSQLATLRQESEKQQALLIAANKSLEEYAIEAKRTRLRIKAQRNTWEAIAACLVVALIVK